MKLFVWRNHPGHYISGVSIVLARDKDHAYELLNVELANNSLPTLSVTDEEFYPVEEVDLAVAAAYILFNGDY